VSQYFAPANSLGMFEHIQLRPTEEAETFQQAQRERATLLLGDGQVNRQKHFRHSRNRYRMIALCASVPLIEPTRELEQG
jgi:hypothetical protein